MVALVTTDSARPQQRRAWAYNAVWLAPLGWRDFMLDTKAPV